MSTRDRLSEAAQNAQPRLQQQIDFILEIDKAKQIFRQNYLLDCSRHENDAEHSWHLAMMAIVLCEYSKEPVDVCRVVKMLLVHDLVEIDAGDTFVYDVAAHIGKEEREIAAAERIFNLLPPDLALEIRQLWDEFEARQTPEALFASSLDRLHPLLQNYNAQGGGWKKHNISAERVRERNRRIVDGAPHLWRYAESLIDDAVAQGFIRAADANSGAEPSL
jgi:putative hydrolase of HD superfamily